MAWGNDRIRDLVVRTLLGESNKTPEGMISVANVMKNRAFSGAWGDANGGLTRAIKAPKQFSMWNTDDPKLVALARGVNAIPTSDPRYQRAAAVADSVFGDQTPDNTNGATHYHTPDVHPPWSEGKTPVATIGGHYFYKIPFNAGNTAGTAAISPSTIGMAGGSADDARSYLASLSAHPDRAGDTANMNPAFVTRLAAAIKQARDAGLPVSVMSGYRDDKQTGSAYDAGGNSSHGYGLASDIAGLDGPNGKVTQAWAQIAAQNGLHNPYGVDNKAEFNHWQLPDKPLEQTPELLASLKATRATGDFQKVWDAYSAADAAGPGIQGPLMEPGEGVNPNVPAPATQPVSATAPAGAPPSPPAGGQSSSAGFAGPGSDKYSLVQSMTTGTSHNPQITTAANWGNLFGGAAPAASTPPASAPAAPLPVPRPALDRQPSTSEIPASTVPPGAPVNEPPASPLSSIVSNWGATTPDAPPPGGSNPDPTATARIPKATPGAPSMGFPAMTNPFGQPPPPDQQTSMLPGSMLPSAQRLLAALFGTGVG